MHAPRDARRLIGVGSLSSYNTNILILLFIEFSCIGIQTFTENPSPGSTSTYIPTIPTHIGYLYLHTHLPIPTLSSSSRGGQTRFGLQIRFGVFTLDLLLVMA